MLKFLAVPIRFAVKEIARARGFKNARQLAAAARVALGTMYGIWDNKKTYVHLKVLERLSDTLKVPVGMLLTDKPEEAPKASDTESSLAAGQQVRVPARRKGAAPKRALQSRSRMER